jgi:DNA polymerase III delta prime subunit
MGEPNPPENRNINTGGGNYNERIEGDYIDNRQSNIFKRIIFSIFQWTNNIFIEQTLAPVGNPARAKNQRLLLADVKQEVSARLKQSLHNAALINLGKEPQPQQVKRPWDADIKIGLKPAEPLPDSTTILEVFDSEEIAGKLLILGEPGSGKTTTQVELAQELIKRAEEQPDYPVPVLFNLSSWKDDRQSLADWLVTELKSKYGVSKKLGQEWINNRQLLPLLDGLDELETQRQELCVQLINQFLASEIRPVYVVVCSRIEEYSSYSSNLHLSGAISLRELNETQVLHYFEAAGRVDFLQTLQGDEALLKLMRTPLFLSITALSVQNLSIEDWQKLETMEARIEHLFDAYWQQQMFNRGHSVELYILKNRLRFFLDKYIRRLPVEPSLEPYTQHKPPTPKQTKLWLIWLAQQIQRESKTEFLIEEMQPYWLAGKLKKLNYQLIYQAIYHLVRGMVSGLILSIIMVIGLLINGVVNRLFNSLTSLIIVPIILLVLILIFIFLIGLGELILWTPFGLIYELIRGKKNLEITLSEKIILFEINKRKIYKILISGFVFGLIGALVNKSNGLLFGLLFGLIGGLFENLISAEPDMNIETKTRANQGIRKSAITALIFGLIQGVIGGLMLGLIGMLINGHSRVFIITFSCFGLFSGLMFGLFSSGGKTCIQHFTLRLILYRNGYIPWNYARFLDYCTERMFLQRVGGRYRFIHKMLRDHFAQMEVKRD